MTAAQQLAPCPPDCQRDCPTCLTVGAELTAHAAEHTARIDEWRRAGGSRYGYTDGGTTDRDSGAA